MDLMYCSVSLPKAIKEGFELLNLALWIWYFPKMINLLIKYIFFCFFGTEQDTFYTSETHILCILVDTENM